MDLHFTLRFVEQLARQVGDRIKQSQRSVSIVSYKDRQDIVTSADLDAERTIISKIKSIFPSHSIFSEEKGSIMGESDYEWIIDPIDGTKEYLRGLPQYNTCFALEKEGELILSVLYRPASGELYSGAKGIGSFENGRKNRLSDKQNLLDSIVYASLPSHDQELKKVEKTWDKLFKVVTSTYRLRGFSEESAAICWVASGKAEAFINLYSRANWYDIAPGILIANQAHATVTDVNGDKIDKNNFNSYIVTNGNIHKPLLALLK